MVSDSDRIAPARCSGGVGAAPPFFYRGVGTPLPPGGGSEKRLPRPVWPRWGEALHRGLRAGRPGPAIGSMAAPRRRFAAPQPHHSRR